MIILSVDQGTSGTKAVLLDGFDVLAVAEVPVRPSYLPDGGVEISPAELLDSVLTAGRQVVAAGGVPPDMVTLANQGETVLAWDSQTGEPCSQAIVWQDSRSKAICRSLEPSSHRIRALTGLTLDPYFSAPKVRWLRDRVPDADVITTTDTWLLYQLSGEFVTDATTASRSLILDLDAGQWSEELTWLFGLGAEALPRIARNDEVIGESTLFGKPAAIGGVVVDQQAALIAQGCLTEGTAKCTYGTGAFLLANTGTSAPRSDSGLTTSIAYSINGLTSYCLDGQIYAAGSTLRWLVELGLLESPQALDSTASATNGGVVFVPGLSGLAAPWWRSNQEGGFAGLGLATGRSEIVRAVVEGIAAHIATLVTAMGTEGSAINRLQVDGGLTHSRVLMQTQADLLQIPVDRHESAHTTALGAAALARLAAGEATDLAEAVGTTYVKETFEPQWSADRAAEAMATWQATVDAMLERQER